MINIRNTDTELTLQQSTSKKVIRKYHTLIHYRNKRTLCILVFPIDNEKNLWNGMYHVVKHVLRGYLSSFKIGDLLKGVQFKLSTTGPINTSACLIEVTTWTCLTVCMHAFFT